MKALGTAPSVTFCIGSSIAGIATTITTPAVMNERDIPRANQTTKATKSGGATVIR